MDKYIDSEKLIDRIDNILAKAEKDEKKAFHKKDANGHLIAVTKTAICVSVKKIITSLQQEQSHFADTDKMEHPEAELEKEFQEYWYLHQYDQRLRRQVVDGHGKAVLKNVASHFYELGLKARKEE